VRILALIAITAACGKSGAGIAPPDPNAWLAPCLGAIDQAKTQPSWQRARTIANACRPCGVAWDPIVAAKVPAPSQVTKVVDACKLDCTKQARADFYAKISALDEDQSPHQAWLALAQACPDALGTPGPDGRYASGAWFALHQIARALAAAHHATDVEIALPLWSQRGTSFELPAADPDPREPEGPIITVTDGAIFIVRDLPRARFTEKGLEMNGDAWPGPHLDAVDIKLARWARLAPIAMPAEKIDAMTKDLGKPAQIVTFAPVRGLFGGEVAAEQVQ